ncbi:hypothetical protein niasHS_000073 [Heterodera schachtii]|uniref:Protein kinase domain-containing protein n=1 Tax=Heterodera schachtii TaxID=97005 RepID=A0ABD2KND2_HETSC
MFAESDELPSSSVREIAYLRALSPYDHIMQFHDMFTVQLGAKLQLCLIFELCETTLAKLIGTEELGREKIKNFLHQVGHQINSIGVPGREYSNDVVTFWYRAPELLLGSYKYAFGIDIWSVGCIFFEMIQRKPLFRKEQVEKQLRKIYNIMGSPDDMDQPLVRGELSNKLKGGVDVGIAGVQLLAKMLNVRPDERISARDALKQAYFQNAESDAQ